MTPNRTLEQTTQEILAFASARFNLFPGVLKPDDDFFKKLGLDSLQALELLTRLENHFGVELHDYELQGITNFRALAQRIHTRLLN